MNNKGITIVELIISFALLMAIVLGMMSIIMSVREQYNEKSFARDMLEYKSTMMTTIEEDLIKKGFVSLSNCATSSTRDVRCQVLRFEDGSTASLEVDLTQALITYNGIKYQIPHHRFIEFLDSQVIYQGTNNVEIKVEGNFLIIDIPYFEIDKTDNNLGFKIVHPINLE